MNENTVIISDSIISPLGNSTEDTFAAVESGKSALRLYPPTPRLPEAYMASLLYDDALEREYSVYGIGPEYTRFERRVILSVAKALSHTSIDPASDRVIFIISTTKANVELLDDECDDRPPRSFPSEAAIAIGRFFHNPNAPIVISNACISGLCAIIEGHRALTAGRYDYAVVTGSDVQSRFIISGFQSLKALSEEECRPFDAGRKGLNAGEAAATLILTRKHPGESEWWIGGEAVRNDANHISGPSRTGEGSYRALKAALGDFPLEELAFVNVHGTATLYNDEMESIALSRAGLQNVPVSALKGTFGHTMGAAGILESILSMKAVDKGMVLGVRGYSECGVTHPLDISAHNRATDKKAFLKLLSGFGGCNAAVLFRKGGK